MHTTPDLRIIGVLCGDGVLFLRAVIHTYKTHTNITTRAAEAPRPESGYQFSERHGVPIPFEGCSHA